MELCTTVQCFVVSVRCGEVWCSEVRCCAVQFGRLLSSVVLCGRLTCCGVAGSFKKFKYAKCA